MKQNISKSADCRAGQHNGYMATSDTWKQCSIFTPTELGGDEVVDALKRRRTVAGEAQRGLEALQRAAYLRHIVGDASGARALYEEALIACPRDEPRLTAEVQSELGAVCLAVGDIGAARAHTELACRMFASLLPEGHPTLQSLIGRIYMLANHNGLLPA
mmetsp:Transcript_4662/g.10265  ORF Transcript_4662/g.10265 Transcript_4662/m.10265 type:complete len:160 (+) Transcript_4662:158-637(+)